MAARKSTTHDLKPRERILEAACELFGRRGVSGVGVDEIATAADSNKMTLYRHFGSKENLGVACLKAVIVEIDAKWRDIEAEGEPAAALANWIGRMARGCTGADSRSELIFAIFRQAREDAAARPLLDAFMAKHGRRLAQLCRKAGVADANTLSTALTFLAHGVRANPWGLGSNARSAQFTELALKLVKAFRSAPAKGGAGSTSIRSRPRGRSLPRQTAQGAVRPRDRILAAGCVLFHRHGVEGASVDEIAAEAESNKMTLYRHFGSKENLATQCFKAALSEAEAILLEIEAGQKEGGPRQLEDFIGLIGGALAGADRRAEMIGMAMQAMRNDTAGRAMMRDFELWQREWLARICRARGIGDAQSLADILLLTIHGANANPWGLDKAQLGARYCSVAGRIALQFPGKMPTRIPERHSVVTGKR